MNGVAEWEELVHSRLQLIEIDNINRKGAVEG